MQSDQVTDTSGDNYVAAGAIGAFDIELVTVGVAVSPASVTEDAATNLAYTFTRTGTTRGALTVNFTVGGTDVNTDYTQSGAETFSGTAGTVMIADGSSTATVTIDPTADTTVEPDETVILTVAAGTGYTVGSPSSQRGRSSTTTRRTSRSAT